MYVHILKEGTLENIIDNVIFYINIESNILYRKEKCISK